MVEHSTRPISVFVSYSHEDTRPRPGFSSSRLDELLNDIKYDLGALSERSHYEFVKDSEGLLRIGDKIDDKIDKAIMNSDIGLIFLSEHYCKSENCMKELLDLIATKKTLALVQLDEAWSDSDSAEIMGIRKKVDNVLTAHFWQKKDGAILRFGHPLPSSSRGESQAGYWAQVDKLVGDIRAVSQKLVKDSNSFQKRLEPRDADRKIVQIVLASSTSDTKSETDRLEHSYVASGFNVFRLDHGISSLTAQSIRGSIGPNDIFVQVVGAIPGKLIEDYYNLPSSIAQYKIAEEEGITQMAWLKAGFDVDEVGEEYARSLNSISTTTGSFEEFESFSLKHANQKQKELDAGVRVAMKKVAHSLANPPLVSIDAAGTDIDLRNRIMEVLSKHVHVDCIDVNASMGALSDAVQDNDAILLIYGEQTEGQKRAKAHFRFFRRWRTEGLNDDQQKFEIAFGDAAPKSASPCPVGPGIHIIRIGDDIDSTSMEAFLRALGVETVGTVQ